MRFLWIALMAGTWVLGTGVASAEEDAPPADEGVPIVDHGEAGATSHGAPGVATNPDGRPQSQTVYVAPHTPDAFWHEGFYLRAAIGFGVMHDAFEVTVLGSPVDFTATGGSFAFDVSVGHSLAPGFILGGSILLRQVVEPEIHAETDRLGVDVTDALDIGVGTLLGVGPIVDWYPAPDGGFHLQGMLGLGRLTIANDEMEEQDQQPVGGLFSVGVGYDWWIEDDWSLGVLGRLTAGTLSDDDRDHGLFTGSVMATVTYN